MWNHKGCSVLRHGDLLGNCLLSESWKHWKVRLFWYLGDVVLDTLKTTALFSPKWHDTILCDPSPFLISPLGSLTCAEGLAVDSQLLLSPRITHSSSSSEALQISGISLPVAWQESLMLANHTGPCGRHREPLNEASPLGAG